MRDGGKPPSVVSWLVCDEDSYSSKLRLFDHLRYTLTLYLRESLRAVGKSRFGN
jgi:hypothetical protein